MNGAGSPDARTALSGLLVVDKPAGCTSHDVVNRVRKLFATTKVGHAGTLDPPATGVLVLGIGKATRLLAFLQGTSKEYRAVVRFGVTTSTQDAEGTVLTRRPSRLTRAEVVSAAGGFVGQISQIPPMVSAVKVGGQPLYRAARRGEEVERDARSVLIHALQVQDFDDSTQSATIYVRCSSGTYIRTLGADLGEVLGTGAHVHTLRRLSVGSFRESEAVELAALEEMDHQGARALVMPMTEAMRDFPLRQLDGSELDDVSHGRALADSQEGPAGDPQTPVGLVDPDGRLVAVYRRSGGGLKPAAVLI